MARVIPVSLFLVTTMLADPLQGQTPTTRPGQEAALVRQVFAAESSFAATMANRDSVAFATFVAPEAVFFGQQSVLRGRAAVVDGWRRLFVGTSAPFSWRPETVEVLASGTLALSSGPVHDPGGRRIGTFSSIWRLEPDGAWRVVFDKGSPVCESERKL